MSGNTVAKIKTALLELGFKPTTGDQLYTRSDQSCVIVTRESWNLGSMSNTSWPGITGKSFASFAKKMHLEVKK